MAEVDIPASDNVELSSDSHLDLDSHYGQDDPDLQLNEALEDAFYQHDFDNAFLNPNAAIDDALWEVFQEQFRPTPNNQTPIQRYSPIPQLPPDFDPQPPPPDMASSEGTTYGTPIELDDLEDATAILTDESCLQHVLEVFPDISLQHVRDLYNKAPPGLSDGEQWLQTFIGNIVESGKYPTEKEAQKGQKRKRDAEDEQDLSDSGEEQNASDKAYADAALRLLSSEFPDLIQKHIRNRLATHQTLFKTFLVLEADNETNTFKLRKRRKYSTNDEPGSSSTPASPTMRRHRIIPPDVSLPNFSRPIKELEAAKKKRDQEAAKTREAAAAARAEEEHFRKAQKQGQTQECGCCCTDYAMDRMINCNNPDPKATHYLCYGCVKTHIETEIGLSRHKIECMHMDGCTSSFSLSVLRKAVPAQSLLKLEKLQQQDDIRLAMEAGGLEDLDECPFCDFKAICPPKEIDREFRCQSDHCGIVSCRLCKLETHIPLSCMEKAAEKGINARHQVEEAMTEALVRSCNKCKNKFIKEFGCNKMTCPVCHNIQCYVCSKNVTNYNHFSDAGIYGGSSSSRKQCPLNDNVNQRHENEVNAAEKEALKKVREENPDLTEEELKIKVSERVKAADDRRRNMGPMGGVLFDAFGAGGPAGLYGMPLPAVPPLVPPRRIGRAAAVQAHPLHRNRRQALPNEAFDDDIRAMEAAMAQEFGFPQNPARQEYEIQLALLEADNQRRRQQREQEAHPMDGFQADYHGQYRERLQEQQALQQRLMQGRAQRPAAVPIMPNYQPIAMQVQPHVHYFADAPPPLPAYPYPIAAAAGGGVQPPQYPGVGDFHLQAQLQAPRTQEQAQNLARARHRAAQAQADRLQEQQDAPRRGLNGRGRRLGVGVAGGWDQWYPRMEDN